MISLSFLYLVDDMFPPRSGSESGSGEHRLSSGDDPRSSAARVPSFFLPQLGAVHRAEQKLKGRVGKTGEISAGLGLQQQSDSAAFFSGFSPSLLPAV